MTDFVCVKTKLMNETNNFPQENFCNKTTKCSNEYIYLCTKLISSKSPIYLAYAQSSFIYYYLVFFLSFFDASRWYHNHGYDDLEAKKKSDCNWMRRAFHGDTDADAFNLIDGQFLFLYIYPVVISSIYVCWTRITGILLCSTRFLRRPTSSNSLILSKYMNTAMLRFFGRLYRFSQSWNIYRPFFLYFCLFSTSFPVIQNIQNWCKGFNE